MGKNKLSLSIIGIIGIILLTAFSFASPIITITDPVDSSIQSSENVPLNWGVSEPILSCAFSLDGGANNTIITIPKFDNVSSTMDADDIDYPNSFTIEGDFLYAVHVEIAGGNKLLIYNITDKSNPVNTANLVNNTSLEAVYNIDVKDDIAYVGTLGSQFTIIDVTDKANPVQLSSITNFSHFELPADVVVSGNFAYLVNDGAETVLSIINVTDKANPVVVGTYLNQTFDGANGIYVINDFAYIISWNSNTFKIIDVSDKTNPIQISSFDNIALMNQPNGIDGDDNFAYVSGLVSNTMVIINITDKFNPTSTGFFSNESLSSFINPNGLVFANDFVYVVARGVEISSDGNTFAIIDVSDKTNPVLFSFLESEEIIKNAFEIVVSGNFAYIRGSFSFPPITVIDFTSDIQNVVLASVSQGGHNVAVSCITPQRDLGIASSSFQVIIPQFAGQIQGEGDLFKILESSGAGLGSFIQFMGIALPTLIIGIMFVGIIVLIGFAIVTVINRVMLKPQ